jgi:hypothetical protein
LVVVGGSGLFTTEDTEGTEEKLGQRKDAFEVGATGAGMKASATFNKNPHLEGAFGGARRKSRSLASLGMTLRWWRGRRGWDKTQRYI